MLVPKPERLIGIEVYATGSSGIGGVIRHSAEDFIVKEVLVDGSEAEINQPIVHQILGSSHSKNRHLLCVMVKRNWDTFQAIRAIAEQLGIGTAQISIAGIKDAKAITAQHMTVEGVSAEDVKKVKVKDIEIRSVGYVRSKLSSYYLLGNSFDITIRTLNHSESAIKKRITKTMQELEAIGGLPNFFGHQRFGTTRPITHAVGKAMVKGNLKRAAMLFLTKTSPHEHPESRRAREELLATQNFRKGLRSFPKQLRYERLMLRHLAKRPGDFIGAFRRLPIQLRELFPQAYQAYLFNGFLSRRIENGMSLANAQVGDYVVNVERSGLPLLAMNRIASQQTLDKINEEIKTGRMQVAIPLVGFKQHPSQGVQGEIEKQILEDEGITTENFKIGAMPEISARGELRTATALLRNLSVDKISEDSTDSSKREAELSFTLHRGSYATILLREIMKPRNPIKAGF